MSNTSPFIKSIQINNVRHLKDIFISLDDFRPRHLILTGPNGSGKTTLLKVLKEYLEGVPNRQLLQVETWKEGIRNTENVIGRFQTSLSGAGTEEEQAGWQGKIASHLLHIEHLKSLIDKFNAVKPALYDLPQMVESYHRGQFLISFFDAKRSSAIQPVTGAQKLDLPKIHPITVEPRSVGSRFLQFLVNQENRAALLLRKGDQVGVAEIQAWMDKITEKFRELFQNRNLKLEYDIDNFDFTINIPGREPFRLVENQLSDGFSAVLQIIAELLMRMEAVASGMKGYNIPGIVLIDEIETHLHIKLQKTILPFLTAFFPNIQFIVTTHSPFVLTSLPDAVIFDLESQTRWENMISLSASTVVEEYFDLDLYSEEIKRLISKLDELAKVTSKTAEQTEEFGRICAQMDAIDYESAPELVAQYRSLRAKEVAR